MKAGAYHGTVGDGAEGAMTDDVGDKTWFDARGINADDDPVTDGENVGEAGRNGHRPTLDDLENDLNDRDVMSLLLAFSIRQCVKSRGGNEY